MLLIFLAIIGFSTTLMGGILLIKGEKIRRWNQVPAIVKNKEVKHSPNKPGATRSNQHEVGILYEYEVEGKKYTSENYMNVTSMMYEKSAQKRVDKIPKTIVVYVNPEDPTKAFYKVTSRSLGGIILIVGISCLLLLFVSII